MERFSIDDLDPSEIVVGGEIDTHTAPTLAEAITRLGPVVRVNLNGCTFIDSAGISCLLEAKRTCERREGLLTLVAPSRSVVQLLNICGMNDLFNIHLSDPHRLS